MAFDFDISRLVFLGACLFLALFYFYYIKPSFSGCSVLIGMLLLFHGPAYYYYFEFYGKRNRIYHKILSVSSGSDVLTTLDLAISLCFVCLCLGVLLCDRLFKLSRADFDEALKRWTMPAATQEITPLDSRLKLLAWGTVVVMLPFVYFDDQIVKVMQYFFTDLGYQDKIALRQQNVGPGYIYRLLLSSAFPCIAILIFIASRMGYQKLMVPSLLLLFMVLLAKAAMFSKAPPVVFVVQVIVAAMITRSLKISLGKATLLLSAFFVLTLMMLLVAVPQLESIKAQVGFIFYRVFMIPNQVLLEYFSAIPAALDHTWGSQFSWVVKLRDAHPLPPNYILVSDIVRGKSGSTSPGMFLADAWADFSWLGVLVLSLICGFVFRFADYQLIVKGGRDPVNIAGLTLTHFAAFTAISTAFQTSMLTGGMYFLVPLLFYFRWHKSR